jgi:predicted transcriptional regulator
VATLVEGEILTGEEGADRPLTLAFASDLMSDVLTLTSNGVLFVTGLCAPQTIRTASVADIHTVLLVRGKPVPETVVALARESGITLLATPFSMYRTCGVLHAAGLKPIY